MKLPCVAADPAGRPCRTCVQMCLQGNGINRRSQIRLVDFGVEEELDLYCQLCAAHAAPPPPSQLHAILFQSLKSDPRNRQEAMRVMLGRFAEAYLQWWNTHLK